ncbi:hypothetical protein [Rheinheimera sp. MM224]|uniref:hypothetical protein n=1 Tax=Rheinheimera sp. MM224 TaxID=3019969 RepID=UPI0021F876C3|nr:hypothetical protein [Rheinheimera sp. MM224]CAI3791155.1 hypothetical protein JAMGFMIE_00227 [Rheinheimera sp. MM224]
MSTATELILFVPGLSGAEAEAYLDKFVTGFAEHAKGSAMNVDQTESSDEGQSRNSIQIETADGIHRMIDIEVVPWADLAMKLSAETPARKIMRGMSLLGFWVFNHKVWSVVSGHKYMLLGTVFAVLVTMMWYVGVLSIFVSSIAAAPEPITTEHSDAVQWLFDWGAAWLTQLADWLNSASLFVLSGIAVTLLPVTAIVDIAYATQNYVLNRNSFFNKARLRMTTALNRAARDTKYQSITIVAYSFGTVVAVEALHAYKSNKAVRLITLGSPLLLVCAISPRVKTAVTGLTEKSQLLQWVDFYSEQDWLCSRSPLEEGDKFSSFELTATVAFDEKVKGLSHELYFTESDVMDKVLAG